MAITKDLGVVTAYGYAVEHGYTGTEEEFGEQMNDVADTAGQAEAWAVGTNGGIPVTESDPQYHNNAKYYAEQAGEDAESAGTSEQNADASADTAEAWAVGTIKGVPVEEGQTGYNDNAKYYAGEASESAEAAAASEQAAKDYSDHIADPVSGIVTEWLNEHVDPATGYVIDDTLTVQGEAADAKATGDAVADLKSAIGEKQLLARGTNLNTVINRGVYALYAQGSQDLFYENVPGNYVEGYSGTLFVDYGAPGFLTQFFFYSMNEDARFAYRRSLDNGTTWTNWTIQNYGYVLQPGTDLNTITQPGFYNLYAQDLNNPYINTPDGYGGTSVLVVDNLDGYYRQILVDVSAYNSGSVASRTYAKLSATWNSWKGYSQSTLIPRGTDLNEVTVHGQYNMYTQNSTNPYLNVPNGFLGKTGFLFVDAGDDSYPWQRLYTANGESFLRNSLNGGSTWNGWKPLNSAENYIDKHRLISIFHTIGVVGDSLASGQGRVNDYSHFRDFYDYSWPQCVKRMTGIEVYNFTESGLTTKTWLTDNMGYPLASDGNHACQCYIIGLGANDIALGADWLGSPADINVEDYTQNADSYYGNYARIIGMLRDLEPRSVIFTCKNPSYGGTEALRAQYNSAVEYMSTIYNKVYCLDINSELYNDPNGFIAKNQVASHYTPAAYQYMAEYLMSLIADIIYNNPEDFWFANLIGTEYSDPVS